MLADHFELADCQVGCVVAFEAFHHQRRACFLLGVGIAIVFERQDDEELAITFAKIRIERLENPRRQTLILRAHVNQLFAPFDDLPSR